MKITSMDCRMYTLSVLTFIALKISYAATEPTNSDTGLEESVNVDDSFQPFHQFYLPDDFEDADKRSSLMRFGKRGSLMRFGKRGSIMRFGKRGSIMRFGKRDGFEDDSEEYYPSALYDYGDGSPLSGYFNDDKRGSLMRFGKKSSIMRFGRSSIKEKKPHVPWRFGRKLGEE